MSATTPLSVNAAITASTTTTDLVTKLQQAALNGASGVPQVAKALSVLDPDLAPKALIASKTPWGTVAVAAVGGLATKFGLSCGAVVTATCWSTDTVDWVAGVATLAGSVIGSYIMRYVTKAPISGIVSAKPSA
jgi:hypothetical protein